MDSEYEPDEAQDIIDLGSDSEWDSEDDIEPEGDFTDILPSAPPNIDWKYR